MLEPEKINPKEARQIREIVKNETRLVGEKLGYPVDPKHPEVLSKVVEIVLKFGGQWRTNLENGDG